MDLIRTGEVCKRLGITRATLYNWEKKGYIKPVAKTLGKIKIWNGEDIEKIIEKMVIQK